MSRHYRDRRETKGHGALGFFITLILIIAAFAVYFFFFTGDNMSGIKGKVYGFFYPQKYSQQVAAESKEFGVDEALIYSVIRTESGFRPEVESHAGAVGLMQLMPDTFNWLQEKLDGEVKHDVSALKDPNVAAAYNAGTTTADNWLGDPKYSADGISLKVIPYEETSHYADKVVKTYDMYKKLYYSGN